MEGSKHLNPAKNLSTNERHQIALQAMRHDQQITELAIQKQVSRNFIYSQKNKALQAITPAFKPANDDEVLFYLPITKKWIASFILCLLLHCRACHRGFTNCLRMHLTMKFHLAPSTILSKMQLQLLNDPALVFRTSNLNHLLENFWHRSNPPYRF